MSTCTVCLYLPYLPESISYRSYFDLTAGGSSILQWMLSQLKCRFYDNVLLLVHDTEPDDTRQVAQSLGIRIAYANSVTRLNAFVSAARITATYDLVVISPTVALFSTGLIGGIYSHHCRQQNNFTSCVGLPEGCDIEVYSVELLRALEAVPVYPLPDDPKSIIAAVIKGAELAGCCPWVQVRAVPYVVSNPSLVGSVDRIGLSHRGDARTARRLTSAMRSERVGEGDVWQTLRQYLVQRARAQRRSFRSLAKACCSAHHPDPDGRRLRVLFVSNASAFSGAEASLCELIAGFNRSTISPFAAVAFAGQFTKALASAGARVLCPNRAFAEPTMRNLHFALALLNSVRPDVVHLNSPSGPAVLFAAQLLSMPIVAHVRVPEPSIFRHELSVAEATIVVSEFVRKRVLMAPVAPHSVHLVYDAVNADRFRRAPSLGLEARTEMGIARDAYVVLMVARYAANKNHQILLSSAEVLVDDIPSLQIVCVGEVFDGEYEVLRSVRRRAAQGKLAGRVHLIGFQRDMRRIYAMADVLVLCSQEEPLGTCVLEAMAMELPVVVTNSGGLSEIIRDGENGFIVPARDVPSLVRRIRQLASDAVLARTVGREARASICERLCREQLSHQVALVYDDIIRARRHGF